MRSVRSKGRNAIELFVDINWGSISYRFLRLPTTSSDWNFHNVDAVGVESTCTTIDFQFIGSKYIPTRLVCDLTMPDWNLDIADIAKMMLHLDSVVHREIVDKIHCSDS